MILSAFERIQFVARLNGPIFFEYVFWNTPHSDVLVTFSPVSVAHGCSYWALRFYAILFKHLENVWRISFHFILSPKGHLELQNFTPVWKSASERRFHQSFVFRLCLYFKTLGPLIFKLLLLLVNEYYEDLEENWVPQFKLVWCLLCK